MSSDRVTLDMERFDRTFAGRVPVTTTTCVRRSARSCRCTPTRTTAPVWTNSSTPRSSTTAPTTTPLLRPTFPGYDVTDQLSAISCPTLVVVGRDDWITPVSESEKIAAAIPGAQLAIFEKSGHSPMSDQPELWTTTVAGFLERACTDSTARQLQ